MESNSVINIEEVDKLIILIDSRFNKITNVVDSDIKQVFADNYRLENLVEIDKLNQIKREFLDIIENLKFKFNKTNEYILQDVIPSYEYLQDEISGNFSNTGSEINSLLSDIEKE